MLVVNGRGSGGGANSGDVADVSASVPVGFTASMDSFLTNLDKMEASLPGSVVSVSGENVVVPIDLKGRKKEVVSSAMNEVAKEATLSLVSDNGGQMDASTSAGGSELMVVDAAMHGGQNEAVPPVLSVTEEKGVSEALGVEEEVVAAGGHKEMGSSTNHHVPSCLAPHVSSDLLAHAVSTAVSGAKLSVPAKSRTNSSVEKPVSNVNSNLNLNLNVKGGKHVGTIGPMDLRAGEGLEADLGSVTAQNQAHSSSLGGQTNLASSPFKAHKSSSFAAIVSGNSTRKVDSSDLSYNLDFFKPSMEGGRVKVRPPMEVVQEGCEEWKSTLIGYFVGKRLPYPVVNSIAFKLWGRVGLNEVLSTERGVFLFKFDTVEQADSILDRAPWHMVNHPMVLKKWQPNLQLDKEEFKRVPVWVRLMNVPFEYWTPKGLSCVASAVGKPLYADKITLTKKRMSFARVCVEIDASEEMITDFDLCCPNGDWITVHAVFEWIPIRCTTCGVLGHVVGHCVRHNQPHVGSKEPKKWVQVTTNKQGTVMAEKKTSEDVDGAWTDVKRKKKGKQIADSKIADSRGESSLTKSHLQTVVFANSQSTISKLADIGNGGDALMACSVALDSEASAPASVDQLPPKSIPATEEILGSSSLNSKEISLEPGEFVAPVEEPVPVVAAEPEDIVSDEEVPILSSPNSLAAKVTDSLEKKKKDSGGRRKAKKRHSPRRG